MALPFTRASQLSPMSTESAVPVKEYLQGKNFLSSKSKGGSSQTEQSVFSDTLNTAMEPTFLTTDLNSSFVKANQV